MTFATQELANFFTAYKKAQQRELGKIPNMEKKRFYSMGALQVMEAATYAKSLEDLIEVLDGCSVSLTVPRTKWLIFDNPEYFMKKALDDAIEAAKLFKTGSEPIKQHSENNVFQLPPKL